MRPTIDETMLDIALVLASRTTCIKKGCGCVLTDRRGRILGSGYNGVARGLPHCNQEKPDPSIELVAKGKPFPYKCEGLQAMPGGESCQAVHAEVNALIQCRAPDAIHTAYCTDEPCFRCTKDLLNTSCHRMVWLRPYGHEPQAAALWQRAGRIWLPWLDSFPSSRP